MWRATLESTKTNEVANEAMNSRITHKIRVVVQSDESVNTQPQAYVVETYEEIVSQRVGGEQKQQNDERQNQHEIGCVGLRDLTLFLLGSAVSI